MAIEVSSNPVQLQAHLNQLDQQMAHLVEVQRAMLQGEWDTARMQLDAIDPANAGKWTNVPFPKAPGQ